MTTKKEVVEEKVEAVQETDEVGRIKWICKASVWLPYENAKGEKRFRKVCAMYGSKCQGSQVDTLMCPAWVKKD